MGNFNPKLPTKYRGTNKYIAAVVTRDRQPTNADVKQPETGTYYSVGTIWQVGKDPTTGTEGQIYILTKIVSNQGKWIFIGGGTDPWAGSFTSLSSTQGQSFSNTTDIFPSSDTRCFSSNAGAENTIARFHMNAVTPGNIVSGFGGGIEVFGDDLMGNNTLYAAFYGIIDDTTQDAENTYAMIQLTNAGSNAWSTRFYVDRVETYSSSGRYRIGSGGVDFMSGTGDPNGSVTAAKGSYYARLDGSSSSTRAYINADGATTWVAVTTAS